MASSKDFLQYAVEQLKAAGSISYRPMFGEYGWYCEGKFLGVICDNQLFVKITSAAKRLFPSIPQAPPYEGAKDYFLIEDLEDRELLCQLVRVTWEALPETKTKDRRKRNGI